MIQVVDARGCSVLHPFVLQVQRCASSVAIAPSRPSRRVVALATTATYTTGHRFVNNGFVTPTTPFITAAPRSRSDCAVRPSGPPLFCTSSAAAAGEREAVATSLRHHHYTMLQASSERPAAGMGSLWVPGMSPGLMDAGSARAQEIARRREEMMGMLHDLPESEYELSLTDLVEKANGESKEPEPEADPARRSTPGGSAGQQVQVQQQQQPPQTAAAPGRPERRRRRRESAGSSFRSSSDGVLLNFYMPRSLTRSFTAPRPNRTPSISGSVASSSCSNSYRERDADAGTVKCWSLPWDRPWRKSSRRDPAAAPPKDNVRAAILKAAKHSPSSPKV